MVPGCRYWTSGAVGSMWEDPAASTSALLRFPGSVAPGAALLLPLGDRSPAVGFGKPFPSGTLKSEAAGRRPAAQRVLSCLLSCLLPQDRRQDHVSEPS